MKKNIKFNLSIFISFVLFFNLFNINNFAIAKEDKLDGYYDNYINAYKESEIKITNDKTTKSLLKASILPSYYDLREEGLLSGVRDQGSIGACWAFGSLASLESNIILNEGNDYDFSEINMTKNSGFDMEPDDGGNYFMAAAYLARWGGPAYESEDPYPIPAISSNINYDIEANTRKHIQNVIFIPDREDSLDNDEIKQAIFDYGAIGTSIYMSAGSFFDYATYGYYNYLYTSTNHAISIVGWDDNYSKDNFKSIPSGDGAFICRNSWGENFGDEGYFYVSYYDKSIGQDNAAFIDSEPINNYDNIYQYDPLGIGYYINYDSSSIWGANVFQAEDTGDNVEDLSAVSFYTIAKNTSYQVYVETDYETNGFSKITNNLVASGTLDMAGYHTIDLDKVLPIYDNKDFAVVIKLTNISVPNLLLESTNFKDSSAVISESGQSFISSDGINWSDLGAGNSNICLKAFTDIDYVVSVTGINLNRNSIYLNEGDEYQLYAAIEPSNAINQDIIWESNDRDTATVDDNGLVKMNKSGAATINAISFDGSYLDSCTINFSNIEYNNDVEFESLYLEKVVRDELGISTGDITSDDMKSLLTVSIENKDIKDIEGLQYAINLKSLVLTNCNIEDISNLKYLYNLNYLDLSYNKICDISSLECLKNSSYLDLNSNGIENLDSLGYMKNLDYLYINNNCVEDINVLLNISSAMELNISNNYIDIVENSANITDIQENISKFYYDNQNEGIRILYSDPRDSEDDYMINKNIEITFLNDIYENKNLDNIKLYYLNNNSKVYEDINVEIDDNNLIINPITNLNRSTEYYIKIPESLIVDSEGNTFENDYYLNFNTTSVKANILELASIGQAYGENVFDTDFDEENDLNVDGRIDLYDLIEMSNLIP